MRPDETSFKPWRLFALLVVPLIALMFAQPAFAGPGETGGISAAPTAAASDHNSLTQFRSIVGQVVLSEDACGTLGPACTIDIVKPSPTATVREAHLFCATTPFGYVPDNDDVTLNGMPVAWDQVLAWMIPPNNTGHNTRADVTAIVKPVGDAAAPGLVPFTVTEDPTFDYDGCALKVIWNDPTTTNNSILIFWGHQETIGDTFVINFAPLSAAAFLTPLEFSLGISFGFQPSNQFSQVDVNNVRLTTSAGGQDDAVAGNLITLGGTGDTTANPPPTAPAITPSNPDDELYDLRPFTSPGATSMTIFTINPSNDDNIFLANLFLRNVTVVDGPPTECPPEDDDDNGDDDDDDNGDDDDDGRRDDDDDDDDDYDGLTNKNETLFLTLLDIRDSDLDGIVDGNDDANGNGEDDDEDDDDDDEDDD